MNYALIENGVVTNIIWLHEGNANSFPSAIALYNRPVTIGDIYDDGDFYRDGEKVLTALEQKELSINEYEQVLNILIGGE